MVGITKTKEKNRKDKENITRNLQDIPTDAHIRFLHCFLVDGFILLKDIKTISGFSHNSANKYLNILCRLGLVEKKPINVKEEIVTEPRNSRDFLEGFSLIKENFHLYLIEIKKLLHRNTQNALSDQQKFDDLLIKYGIKKIFKI